MPRTCSGRRCACGQRLGQRQRGQQQQPRPARPARRRPSARKPCSSTTAPSDGASTGATPSTSISRDITVAAGVVRVQVADHRDGHHHAAGGAHALQTAGDTEQLDVRREQAQQRGDHVQHDAGHQRPATAQRIRQRTDDQLADRQPGQRPGQRQLRHRRRHRQVLGDPRQRRQIHVDGERAQRHQRAQHHDHPQIGSARPVSVALPCSTPGAAMPGSTRRKILPDRHRP